MACQCQSNETHVPDFSVAGFAGAQDQLAAAHAQLSDVKALQLSVCVGASYNASTNKICFSIPIYGDACITSPVSVPVGGELKACAQTCGNVIPTGVRVTVYLNGAAIFSGTVFGRC
ncbi:MAG: hypothetical protein AMXMBFR59_36930 [Rhodanobacteraceae bacterium]